MLIIDADDETIVSSENAGWFHDRKTKSGKCNNCNDSFERLFYFYHVYLHKLCNFFEKQRQFMMIINKKIKTKYSLAQRFNNWHCSKI